MRASQCPYIHNKSLALWQCAQYGAWRCCIPASPFLFPGGSNAKKCVFVFPLVLVIDRPCRAVLRALLGAGRAREALHYARVCESSLLAEAFAGVDGGAAPTGARLRGGVGAWGAVLSVGRFMVAARLQCDLFEEAFTLQRDLVKRLAAAVGGTGGRGAVSRAHAALLTPCLAYLWSTRRRESSSQSFLNVPFTASEQRCLAAFLDAKAQSESPRATDLLAGFHLSRRQVAQALVVHHRAARRLAAHRGPPPEAGEDPAAARASVRDALIQHHLAAMGPAERAACEAEAARLRALPEPAPLPLFDDVVGAFVDECDDYAADRVATPAVVAEETTPDANMGGASVGEAAQPAASSAEINAAAPAVRDFRALPYDGAAAPAVPPPPPAPMLGMAMPSWHGGGSHGDGRRVSFAPTTGGVQGMMVDTPASFGAMSRISAVSTSGDRLAWSVLR